MAYIWLKLTTIAFLMITATNSTTKKTMKSVNKKKNKKKKYKMRRTIRIIRFSTRIPDEDLQKQFLMM